MIWVALFCAVVAAFIADGIRSRRASHQLYSDAVARSHPRDRIGAGSGFLPVPAAGEPIDERAGDSEPQSFRGKVHHRGVHARQHGSSEARDHG